MDEFGLKKSRRDFFPFLLFFSRNDFFALFGLFFPHPFQNGSDLNGNSSCRCKTII